MTIATPITDPDEFSIRLVAPMLQQEPEQKYQRKQRRRRRKRSKQKKKHNNNNQIKYLGLIQGGILKGVTVSPGTIAQMTTDL